MAGWLAAIGRGLEVGGHNLTQVGLRKMEQRFQERMQRERIAAQKEGLMASLGQRERHYQEGVMRARAEALLDAEDRQIEADERKRRHGREDAQDARADSASRRDEERLLNEKARLHHQLQGKVPGTYKKKDIDDARKLHATLFDTGLTPVANFDEWFVTEFDPSTQGLLKRYGAVPGGAPDSGGDGFLLGLSQYHQ